MTTVNPAVDWHAFAPDVVLVGDDRRRPARRSAAAEPLAAWQTSRIAAVGVLGALIPVLTLAADGHNRSMFGGAYVVDNYALALKGFFLVVTYITILLSVDYIAEGDYSQGEFYFLLLTSVLGMSIMASAPRPHHPVRRAGDDLDPHLRPRRLSQARPRGRTRRASSTT